MDLHIGSGAQVMVGANVSDLFSTTSRVRQGCVLEPALFCHAIDWILDNMTCLKGVALANGKFTDLDYPDDIVCQPILTLSKPHALPTSGASPMPYRLLVVR